MQENQTLKAEIISALDRLPLDSLKLLAKFVAFLRTNAAQESIQELNPAQKIEIPSQSARVMSPRLVHREQAAEFKKEIVEIAPNDSL